MSIKNGKKPLSSKAQTAAAPISIDDVFGNALGLSADLLKILDKEGYAHRFVSAAAIEQSSGYHQSGWKPVSQAQLKKWGHATMDSHSFSFGTDPEGYIRRGDLVLALRPQALNEKHRAYLAQEAQRGQHVQKKHAEELRRQVADAGADIKIHEGFDDDKSE
jgi:hypothetical protein